MKPGRRKGQNGSCTVFNPNINLTQPGSLVALDPRSDAFRILHLCGVGRSELMPDFSREIR